MKNRVEKKKHFTFSVHNCKVGVGRTDRKDEFMPNEWLICVHGTYRLNQLQTRENSQQHVSFFKYQDRHFSWSFIGFLFLCRQAEKKNDTE